VILDGIPVVDRPVHLAAFIIQGRQVISIFSNEELIERRRQGK